MCWPRARTGAGSCGRRCGALVFGFWCLPFLPSSWFPRFRSRVDWFGLLLPLAWAPIAVVVDVVDVASRSRSRSPQATRVAPDLLTQQQLLHFGLEESQRLLAASRGVIGGGGGGVIGSESLAPEAAWALRVRLRLLQQRDRLESLGAIWDKGEWSRRARAWSTRGAQPSVPSGSSAQPAPLLPLFPRSAHLSRSVLAPLLPKTNSCLRPTRPSGTPR